MAFPTLCYTALEHVCEAVTHSDHKIQSVCRMTKADWLHCRAHAKRLAGEMKAWVLLNPWMTFFMLVGLGGTAFKSKTIAKWMESQAESFTKFAQSRNNYQRFGLIVVLMVLRLFVSTLVPPTSPAFSVIV